MKKRSILLTCIAALMALAMFVGCDNAPVFPDMPKSVKGGYLTQTGVILTNQDATADKFNLAVYYDNGDDPVVMPATNIQLDGTGNVFAVAGLDSENNEVMTQKLVVEFTDANRIEATGFKESYTVEEAKAIKPSDITVKAFYEGGEMNLTSSEFTVTYDTTELKDSLVSPSHPTEEVEITIHPTVGVAAGSNALDETYVITVKYSEEAEAEYAIESVDKVKFADTAIIKGLAYDEIPVPSFDDVEFIVTYDNGVQSTEWVKLTEESGVTLSYVDFGTKLELNKKNLVNDTRSYEIKAVYNDEPVYFEGSEKPVTQVSAVQVTPVEGYKAPTFKEGQAFESPVSEDFDVVLAYADGSYERLNAAAKEDVVFSYVKATPEAYKPVDEFVESDVLVIKAEYKGVTGYSAQTITVQGEDDPVPVAITDVEINQFYNAPAKQYYNSVSTIEATLAINAIDSITVSFDKGEPQVIRGFTADNLAVEYSLTSGSVTELDKDSLVDVDTIYIHLTWSYADAEKNVHSLDYYYPVEKLSQAYASEIKVSVDYDKTSYDEKPMYGTAYDFTVEAVNEYGVVSTLAADEYTIDGTLPETVTAAKEFTINAIVAGADGQKAITGKLSLGEPVAYVDAAPDDLIIVAKEGTPAYMIDTARSNYFSTATVSNYEVTGYDAYGEAEVTIDSTNPFVLMKTAVESGENTVYVRVSYTDSTGKIQKNVLVPYTFDGVAFTDDTSIVLSYNGEEPLNLASDNLYYNRSYNVADFGYDTKAVIHHGNATVNYLGCVLGTYDSETSVPSTTGTIRCDWADDPATDVDVNFLFGYVDGNGVESIKVITLTFATEN